MKASRPMHLPELALLFSLSGCGSASATMPRSGKSGAALDAPVEAASGSCVTANSTGKTALGTKSPPAPVIDLVALETQVATRGFRLGSPVQVTPTPDGRAVLFLRSGARNAKQSLFETSLKDGTTKELLSPDALIGTSVESLSPEEKARRERLRISASGFTAFEIAPKGESVLVSLSGRLYVVRRSTGAFHELPTGSGSAFDPHLSPDGRSVAYVRDNDVRRVPLEPSGSKNAEVAITHGGTERVPNGMAEFIAQEELDRQRGFWWSSDSAQMIFETYDASRVETLTISDPAHPEKTPAHSPYPRAGRENADVRLAIASTAATAGKTKPIEIAWDHAKYPYLVSVSWNRSGPPTIYVMTRAQTDGVLLAVDRASGKTRTLLEEHDDAWLAHDSELPRWLHDGSGFLWSAERDGGLSRLELHDAKGALVRTLTDDQHAYRALVDVDDDKGMVSYLGGASAIEQGLFRVPIAGGAIDSLTDKARWVNRVTFAEEHQAYAMATSSLAAERTWVARALGTVADVTIPSIAESPPAFSGVELATITPDRLRVAIVRPHGFDPAATYPLIDAAYGGPTVNVVTSEGMQYVRAQWLADATGAVVVAIDGRGTPHRDHGFERAMKNGFGHVPLDGHVAAIEALRARSDLHLAQAGVFGWSFGGYFSALAILRRPDVYRVAFAGAPVADWRDYDTAYTERYLGMPNENAAVYEEASLLTWASKKPTVGSPSRPLLLVHGSADDNVYFLHSLRLADALERAGRPFELLPLAGVTHQLADPSQAAIVWKRAAEFLRAGLGKTE